MKIQERYLPHNDCDFPDPVCPRDITLALNPSQNQFNALLHTSLLYIIKTLLDCIQKCFRYICLETNGLEIHVKTKKGYKFELDSFNTAFTWYLRTPFACGVEPDARGSLV